MTDWTKVEAYRRGVAFLWLRERLTFYRVHPKLRVPTSRELREEAFRYAGIPATSHKDQ